MAVYGHRPEGAQAAQGAIACGDVTSQGAMVASTLRSAKLNRMRIFQSTGMAKHVWVDREWHLGGLADSARVYAKTLPKCRLESAMNSMLAHRKNNGISGAKGRNGRPAFDTLCRDATKRQFDIVMAWNVDRLGRSLKDLVAFLSELHALGIDLFLHQQGLDTTTPAGKAMFQCWASLPSSNAR